MWARGRARGGTLGLLLWVAGVVTGCSGDDGSKEQIERVDINTAVEADADQGDAAARTRRPNDASFSALRVGEAAVTPAWLVGPLAVVG